MAEAIVHFAIYNNPRDYPGQFVVRRWFIGRGELLRELAPYAVTGTLEAARAAVPPGMYRLDRDASDDAVIVEVWI
jgi:hypothetical protein